MKHIEENSIGGRIRTARKNQKLKMKELAERIDVVPNYLSMIKRNLRTPSNALMEKIANATNTSAEWLWIGDGQQSVFSDEQPLQPGVGMAAGTPDTVLDMRMFLLMLKWNRPDLFPDGVRAILDIPPETLEDIMDGSGEVKYDPKWQTAIDLLLPRMDWVATSSAYRTVEALFRNAALAKNQKIITSIMKYLVSVGRTDCVLQSELVSAETCDIGGIQATIYTLPFKGYRHFEWLFKIVETDAEPENSCEPEDDTCPDEDEGKTEDKDKDEDVEAMDSPVMGFVNGQLAYLMDNNSACISLVFRSKTLFKAFKKEVTEYWNKAKTVGDGEPKDLPEEMQGLFFHDVKGDEIQACLPLYDEPY